MAGKSSLGTKIFLGDGQSPQTFREIKHCGDIDAPSGKRNYEETTTHTSADSGGFEEYEPTTRNAEMFKFPINLDMADPIHQELMQLEDSGAKRDWKVRLNFLTPFWIKCSGSVATISIKAPVKGIYQGEVEVKVTGAITRTESELP